MQVLNNFGDFYKNDKEKQGSLKRVGSKKSEKEKVVNSMTFRFGQRLTKLVQPTRTLYTHLKDICTLKTPHAAMVIALMVLH